MKLRIGIINNQGRLYHVWKLLEKEHKVSFIGKGEYDVLIFGLKQIALADVEGASCQMIVCGLCSEEVKERYNTLCLLEDEFFLLGNARVTAWGILEILMRHSDVCLSDLSVDVVGYGRCGKQIMRLLEMLQISYRVIVKTMDCVDSHFMHYEEYVFHQPADWIIMTIEQCIFDKYWVERFGSLTSIIDITSGFKGTAAIRNDNVRVLFGKGLPDIYCCKSGAEVYIDAFMRVLV